MPNVTCNDVTLHVETTGKGPPVAFLNGIMMTTASWTPQTSVLSDTYQCVLHDMRGQLRSEKPDRITLRDHVDDFRALLDHLGIDACHVVGTSYGGEVGLLFADAYPERVQSLTVISAVSEVGPRLRRQTEAWAAIARSSPEHLYTATIPDNYSSSFLEANPGAVRAGRTRMAEYPTEFFSAFARLVEAFLTIDITDRLPHISCPTLVLCGEKDTLKPVHYSQRIANRLPHSTFLTIPNAGHAVVVERPTAINTALRGFLQTHI